MCVCAFLGVMGAKEDIQMHDVINIELKCRIQDSLTEEMKTRQYTMSVPVSVCDLVNAPHIFERHHHVEAKYQKLGGKRFEGKKTHSNQLRVCVCCIHCMEIC